jgi:hypothetical protein
MSERTDPLDQRRARNCHNGTSEVVVMTKAGLSPTRLRRKVLALCAEANYVGDLISELAHEARDQQKALLLAGRAHRIAVEAVSPEIFGQVFATDEGDED